ANGEFIAMRMGKGPIKGEISSQGRGEMSVVILRPAHIFGAARNIGSVLADPLASYLWSIPPVRLGSADSKMSMVSVSTVVEVSIRAAKAPQDLNGKCYAVKDLDANFFQFYQEQVLGRKLWPLLRVPDWAVLLAARAADWWYQMITCMTSLQNLPAPFRWFGCIYFRDPMLCLTSQGVRQALLDLTIDDAATKKNLGDYNSRFFKLAL
ncbi:unnamed protein product, partial [Polarella glacialis]